MILLAALPAQDGDTEAAASSTTLKHKLYVIPCEEVKKTRDNMFKIPSEWLNYAIPID